MPSVTLTETEIAALIAERNALIASIAARTAAQTGQGSSVARAIAADDAQRKVFSLYDTDIIGNYYTEREALTGQYVENPVTVTDFEALGNLDGTNRLYPAAPSTAPVRITEFDGGGLETEDNELDSAGRYGIHYPDDLDIELFWIVRSIEFMSNISNGLGDSSPTVTSTAVVNTAISETTTQITVNTTNANENASFEVGDTFLVVSGTNQVAVEVTDVILQINGDPTHGSCSISGLFTEGDCTLGGGVWTSTPTFYHASLGVKILSSGSVATGGTIDVTWSGFSDSDRIAKVDSTDSYTYLLTNLIADIDYAITQHIRLLQIQRTALVDNLDPNLAASALIDVTTKPKHTQPVSYTHLTLPTILRV